MDITLGSWEATGDRRGRVTLHSTVSAPSVIFFPTTQMHCSAVTQVDTGKEAEVRDKRDEPTQSLEQVGKSAEIIPNKTIQT